MKKVSELGKRLSNVEQRKIAGAKREALFCECLGSGSLHDVVVCTWTTTAGFNSCYNGAMSYCGNAYGSGAVSCNQNMA